MRKTKNITKYEPYWQFLRVRIKGNNSRLEWKLQEVWKYFQQKPTQDRYERVVNWMEGLIYGFKSSKDSSKIEIIEREMDRYPNRESLEVENWCLSENRDEVLSAMKSFSTKDRLENWKNNFTRCKQYLQGGFFHRDLNLFLDLLYQTFSRDELQNISENYSMESLYKHRSQVSLYKKSVHFFF